MKLKIIILSLFFACAKLGADVLNVGVTIPPQLEPVKAIFGTNAIVHVLMDSNQNPHFFRPSAKKLSSLANCDLYFTIGFPGEENVEKKFKSRGKPSLVPMLEEVSTHSLYEHNQDNSCGDTDIHYWTSPIKLKAMARVVCLEACKLMPSASDYFKGNLTNYEKACDKVLEDGQMALKAAGVSHVLTYHPALGNYASAMCITQLSIEKDGRAPTLGVVAKVVTEAHKYQIKKLFVQNSGEAGQSKIVLSRLGAEPIIIQVLSSEPLELIKQITDELVN